MQEEKAHQDDNAEVTNSSIRHWQDYGKIKEEVVRILTNHPEGMTGASIAQDVGITQGAMSKYLSMLNVDGIITSRRVGVAKLWKVVVPSDRANMLVVKLGSKTERADFKDYAKSVTEKDGELLDANSKRVMIMPTTILLNLYKYTKSIIGSEVHTFFYQWGKDYAHEIREFVIDITEKTGINSIESFLLLLRLKGWGNFNVTFRSDESIEVIWHNSIWSELDIAENKPVDDFMAGALGEAAMIARGGKWTFIEQECKSLGSKYCRFVGNKSE